MTEPAAFRLEGLDHIALAVRDVATSVRWYREVLGFERWFEEEWGDCPAFIGLGQTAIALFPRGDRGDVDHAAAGFRHFALRADRANFDAARRSLADRGIALEFEDHGASLSIYFVDPDGYNVEITTYEV